MPFYKVRSGNSPVASKFRGSFVLLCFTIAASAQQSSFPALTNVDSAEVWFDRILNPKNAAVINGSAYYFSFKGLKTHPFYQSEESDRSFVRYDNDLYENLDLLYDTYGDILVLKSLTPMGAFFIKLDKSRVQEFELHHHFFKKLNEGVSDKGGAYFDILFEAKQFAVVAKRSKVERIEGRIRDYLEEDIYYVLNNGKWIRITGKGSFSKTLGKEQRKELTNFIKDNHINLRKRKDEDLKKIGAFCYSLKERKQ